MILTFAVAMVAVAAALLFQARVSAKNRNHKSYWANLAAGVVLLVGAGGVAWIGILHPTLFLPRPEANCTWGLGAAADSCGHSTSRIPDMSTN
ncbi:MAG TPA: hypothetical protein VMU85_13945 [Stellaceae bacterium]|nr:hypothetical protein [Stellaceae bacterium]